MPAQRESFVTDRWLVGTGEVVRVSAPGSCLCTCDLESWFPPCMSVEKLWNSIPNFCFTFLLKSAFTSQIANCYSLRTDPRTQRSPRSPAPPSQPTGADGAPEGLSRVAPRAWTSGHLPPFLSKVFSSAPAACWASDIY